METDAAGTADHPEEERNWRRQRVTLQEDAGWIVCEWVWKSPKATFELRDKGQCPGFQGLPEQIITNWEFGTKDAYPVAVLGGRRSNVKVLSKATSFRWRASCLFLAPGGGFPSSAFPSFPLRLPSSLDVT